MAYQENTLDGKNSHRINVDVKNVFQSRVRYLQLYETHLSSYNSGKSLMESVQAICT